MTTIRADFDLSSLRRADRTLVADQLPFAAALALTRLAKGVSAEETRAVVETFDSPTPFTQKGFAVQPATKRDRIAYVMAKDITAQYLEPYIGGGPRSLGNKKAMLVPRRLRTNQYGNLPCNKLASLKAKPNVFVGSVTFRKTGETVSGVWERGTTPRGTRRKGGGEYGTKGNNRNQAGAARTTLKLLIEFEPTTTAPKHFPFFERARAYVVRHAREEFSAALRQALSTSRNRR